ncbi:MAG: 4'-phosphopantetheinyl transferase superfamily protein [Chloroflexaceae bacterium]|nr:4'-phosphopantetheinyl transferase superfamily protein [Chloroflexaceae bacterium]
MITWLTQTERDLPALAPSAWLSLPERERLAALRVEKRRREWLLGRWTARRLIQRHLAEAGLACDPRDLEIVAAPSGAPTIGARRPELRAALEGWHLTISHSQGRALCALARTPAIGADIEQVAPRHPAFAGDYFTSAERAAVAAAPPEQRELLVTAIWSAKESALKALRLGLSVDTRRVECRVAPASGGAWATVALLCDPILEAPPLCGWWRVSEGYVLTLAVGAA